MATYGIDYSCINGISYENYDIDLTFLQIGQLDVLLEDVYKKLTTAPNLFWYIGGTIDCGALLNTTFTNQKLLQLKKEISQLFFDELRFSIEDVQVLFRKAMELIIQVVFIPSNDPNLRLQLELVANSNEVKIVRIE